MSKARLVQRAGAVTFIWDEGGQSLSATIVSANRGEVRFHEAWKIAQDGDELATKRSAAEQQEKRPQAKSD